MKESCKHGEDGNQSNSPAKAIGSVRVFFEVSENKEKGMLFKKTVTLLPNEEHHPQKEHKKKAAAFFS